MLEGMTILITGAGSGIGEGSAKLMARYGANIMCGDINLDSAKRVAGEIEANGGHAQAYAVDIAREEQAAQFVQTAVQRFGRIDGAFNNAAIAGPQRAAVDLTAADWDSLVSIDLVGVWNCVKHEVAAMRAGGGGGSIVNTSSNASLTSIQNMAAYGAVKAGVNSLTRTLALELGPENIRVNAISPGTIRTPVVLQLEAEGYDYSEMAKKAPLRRLGEPEDIGELAAWLLSPRSSFVTAQVISVDGGVSAGFFI